MTDDMFFADGDRSLRRGKRGAKRTDTCRPCLVEQKGEENSCVEGVVMDVTPFGLQIRIMDVIPVGTRVVVQLMRDDEFTEPLSRPLDGMVVRLTESSQGFADHGIKLTVKDIPRIHPRAMPDMHSPAAPDRKPSRMHTIDYTVGGDPTHHHSS